ncbi:UDP-N-acetylmuramate--L-alanine ligase [Tenacibaculum sp. M341]|uniref:UDP-N-acetylmuramate--L-alanine ligase n=1 Tax=Tenacibaculum sp. M341 TaxID=2530339 RepID=UPI00104500E1|nr:UDP-N-acetylmuramate--L-alanine ligase [Tenacibaculum sp. M341]TCI91470.1 UDP-N-acetylmuramate--L-alanine ligase [Tenacibaculum sp. M341]
MNLKEIHNIYFIGIGGIGMSAIARYFSENKRNVAGYDKTPSLITGNLSTIGIDVNYNDAIESVPVAFLNKETTLIVYTPAIPKENLQLNYFIDNDFVVLKRAEILGRITENTFCLGVAGTHGKTTTSSILGHIMQSVEATAFLGGIAENYDSNLILGKDEVSVVEADEFDRSFLQLSPNIACVTSMDADHLDIYGNHDELKDSFKAFSDKVSQQLVVAKGLPLDGLTYAIEEEADYKAENIRVENGAYIFDVKTPSDAIKEVELSLSGRHNVMNALAAIALSDIYGLSLEVIKDRLRSFKGVRRRFSYKIKTSNRVLIDDYAHHPTEISAVEDSVREMYPGKKVLVVFQPHLFTRTRDFVDGFAESLSRFDEVVLLDIYPARELPIEGVNSSWLLSKIKNEKKKLTNKKDLIKEIKNIDAEVVVMLGAGDIGLLVDDVKDELLKELKLND